VVTEILDLITYHDLVGFGQLWGFLEARFFSHLDTAHARTVADLKTRLDRLFLVHALRSDRKDAVHAFFNIHGPDLHKRSRAAGGGRGGDGDASGGLGGGSSWSEWFALPYLPDPASDPTFAPYFSGNWVAALRASLGNFLSLVFRAAPLPKLLLLEKWHRDATQLVCVGRGGWEVVTYALCGWWGAGKKDARACCGPSLCCSLLRPACSSDAAIRSPLAHPTLL